MMFSKDLTKVARALLTRYFSTPKHSSQTPLQTPTDTGSLFHYTSGRWMWNEQEQLTARYRFFNVPGLQRVACQAVGAEQCISLEKIGEGNYNKAYRLVTGDGQKVIAKIPHPNAGPPVLTTASEVATMEFARTVLNIPVPKVLAWSATDQNPVNAEYIVMEEAKGSQLHDVWQNLPLRAKCDFIDEIVDVERKWLSISFSKIGSLYFNDCGIRGCAPLNVTADSRETGDYVQSKFCIGPIIRTEFWEKERSNMHQYHGNSSEEYLESVAHREIDWIKGYADAQKAINHPWQYTNEEQKSPEAHINLLQKFLSAIPHIVPKSSEIVSPRIWHPDFHAGNIYVDDQARISSIIDWQGAWVSPVFLGFNPSTLLDYGVEVLMKLPENFKDLDEATKTRLRYQVSQSILIHTYERLTAQKNPLMHKMMNHPHGQTLKRLEAFAGATWDNCLFPLRESLICAEKGWEHFVSTDKPCPFHFSAEEIRKHSEEVDSFNDNRQLWQELEGTLTDEGFTLNETYEEAVKAVEKLKLRG